MSPVSASPEPYAPGDEIPGTRCTFERVLGEGGYGTVLLCRHVVLKRRVVLKLLLMSHRGRDDLVDRMLAEAQALAQLDHPNIALIHDAGMTGEDAPRPFLTLQYYPGETLAQSLAAMPPGSGIGLLPALDLGIELCDGLRAAHERGIVHRDVKPANVYLARTGEGRTVTKVIDFGIAHFKEATTRATGKMYLGTPRYSAPEQMQGLPPSARTDLYAVGLVLYDCLCGRGPFDPREGHLDANAMMRAHLQEEPAPLSAYGSDLPEELDALVAALVAKRPEDRPPTAALVAARLREIRARLQATASPVQAADDANRTDPTPFDNRQIRYSADTDGTSPATGGSADVLSARRPTGGSADVLPARRPLPERGRDLEERAQATPPADSTPAVGPAGTVRLTPNAVDGAPAALPAATSEPLDRGAVTPSMAPEPAARSTHRTEDYSVGPPDVVRVDPGDDADGTSPATGGSADVLSARRPTGGSAARRPLPERGRDVEEQPRTLSDAPVVSSQAPPPPRARRLRARMAAALGGAMTAVALSAGIWHLRQTPGSGATSRLVGSPVGSAVMAASFAGGPAARPSATPVPAPSSGLSPSAARMLAAPADETTSPSASNAKTAPSPSASASAHLPSQGSPARSRAAEKQKGDPLSELKRTFSTPPGPLERPGVTF